MELDEALLAEACSRGDPLLRVYAWNPPCVSLGRFQDAGGIDLEYARARGWDVVRRPTGGRAVLHQHEVTYAVALPPSLVAGVGVRSSYTVLAGALHAGLRAMLRSPAAVGSGGSHTGRVRSASCFAAADECDVITADGKLVGSAQVRRGGGLLQHGSILLDAEPAAWAALFGTAGRLVTLRQLLGRHIPHSEARAAVVTAFASLSAGVSPDIPAHCGEEDGGPAAGPC